MNNSPIKHKSVRLLVINEHKELLLLRAEDPSTRPVGGSYNGHFWYTLGGEIEMGEDLMKAASRELFEESGLRGEDVEFGPVVWHGEFDLVLSGELKRLEQWFVVVKTKKLEITLENLTEDEKRVVTRGEWFDLERIKKGKEIIYPVILEELIENLFNECYPKEMLEVDLARQPAKGGTMT